jgi:hypothetical protein
MQEAPFFCLTCQKKYILDKECLAKVGKSSIQKKAPFIDQDEQDKVIETKFAEQDTIYKCPICGFTLKEIKDE